MAPAFEEFRRAEFQCCGNERDVFKADISFAAFNSADIAAIQAHSEREVFLTPPTGLPEFADTTAEEGFDIVDSHDVDWRNLTTMSPRTISPRPGTLFLQGETDDAGRIAVAGS